METQKCTTCGKKKLLTDFNFKNKALGIRHKQCKICTRKTVKSHYHDNKTYYMEKAKTYNEQQWLKLVAMVNRYLKDHPCVDCGETDIIVLQFDHVRDKKRNSVSRMVSNCCSEESIRREIQKCQVRCSNCHIRKTAKQLNWTTRLP